uniref:JmjC domain-containing protein n=1 Tax=Steinernema glaseri TaxID=37863 RepID=A0A1I7ZBJ5_9BILA
MIPSGWIHCVYTPEDSLVFGGNFMHSFSVGMQLRVPKLERRLKITKKYRYPFFGETLWYVASGVVLDGTGKKHVRELPIVLPDEKPVKEEEDEEEEHYESDEDATPAKVKREGKTEKRQEPVKKMASNNGTAVKQEAETDLETKDVKKMEMQEPDATAPEALGTDSELLDSKEEIGCKIGYPSPPELIQEPSPKKLKQSMEEEDEDTVYIYGDDGTSKSAVHLNASSESASLESSSRPETPSRVHALNNSYSHITNPPLDEYTFNEEYLTSLSMHERHGLKILADFLHKVLKRKKQDLAEGIDDPKELLKDLYACLRKAAELNPIGEKGENDDDDEMPLLDPEEDNRQPFPEDKNPKKPKTPKGPALKKGTATKKKTPAKTKTPRAKAKKEEIIPDIIDGMPRPTQKVAKENSYGYDPLANVSALGHAPLQSAFRRTANMAKPPPNQKFVNANLTKIQIPTESPNSSAPPSAVSPAIPTFSPRARNAPSTPLYKDGKAIDPTTGMVDLFHSTPSTSTPSEQFSPRMSPLDSDSGKARPLRRFSDVSDSGSPKIAPPKKFSAQKDRTVAPPKLLSDVSVVSPAKKTTVQQDPRNFESLKNSMGYKEATTDDLHSTGLGMSFPIKSPSEEALRKASDIDRNRNSILSTPVDGVASDPVELSRLLADATVQYDKYPTNIM